RGRQDEPARGHRLPGYARLAPGRAGRQPDPGRGDVGGDPRRRSAGPAAAAGRRGAVPGARDRPGVGGATVFAPEDLGLVRGDPEERRRFLDTLATQRLPRYHGSRQDYDRVLRQRNPLLRSAGGRLPATALATLEV